MDILSPEFRRVVDTAASPGDKRKRVLLWEAIIDSCLPKPTAMAEIGVWKGRFASRVLERCREVSRYYMIDPWAKLPDWNKPWNKSDEEFTEVHEEALANTEFAADRRTVLRGRTIDVIDQIPDGSLDFAYVDGDHTLRGITVDLIRVLPKIKPGGVIGGDDFQSHQQHEPGFEPTLVCPFAAYWAEAMDFPFIALPYRQYAIQVRPGFQFVDASGVCSDISLSKMFAQQSVTSMAKRMLRIITG